MSNIPAIEVNDGAHIPQLGFGVFQIEPEKTAAAVRVALEIGYRHIDTAQMYGNEKEVGQGIRDAGLDRGDVFVRASSTTASTSLTMPGLPMGGCGHPSADTSWTVEQAAPFADRRPVGDGAALAAPSDVTAARACDGADQHPARSRERGLAH